MVFEKLRRYLRAFINRFTTGVMSQFHKFKKFVSFNPKLVIYVLVLLTAIFFAYFVPLVILDNEAFVSIAFSGFTPFTIAVGLIITGTQYLDGIQREAKSKVYAEVAQLMRSPRALGTLNMVKYAGPIELEEEDEPGIGWARDTGSVFLL